MDVGRIYYKMGTINLTASTEYLNHKYSQVANICADWWESTLSLHTQVEAENNTTLQAKIIVSIILQTFNFLSILKR